VRVVRSAAGKGWRACFVAVHRFQHRFNGLPPEQRVEMLLTTGKNDQAGHDRRAFHAMNARK